MTSAVSTPTMAAQSRPGQGWLGWIETRTWLLGLLLVVATLALYYPVHHHPFVNYDDSVYVTENPHVQSGLDWDTVKWAFTTYDAGNWHPLTWLSHTLDCQLFELNPAGHHDVNLLLARAQRRTVVLGAATGDRFCGPQLHGCCVICPTPD